MTWRIFNYKKLLLSFAVCVGVLVVVGIILIPQRQVAPWRNKLENYKNHPQLEIKEYLKLENDARKLENDARTTLVQAFGPLVAAVSAVIAAIGAVYVYRQYRRAQEWRKGDLAAALMERLESDEELAFACQALDWGTGPIMVPERYRPLMKQFNMPNEAVLDHEPDILALALKPFLNTATVNSAKGLIYRHCFDKLFNHIQNIGRLVASDQVTIDGLDGLDYWLRRIASYEYAPENLRQEIFQPALAIFGYHKIPELGRKLAVVDWSVYDRCRNTGVAGQ